MAKKVAIVGAGVGGLATGIRLAAKGYQVEIFEKEALPGGKMNLVQGGGYRFDLGPTILMMPQIYQEVFKAAGADPDKYIPMTRLEPMYRLNYPDGDVMDFSNNLVELTQLLERYGESQAQGYLDYLADIYSRYLVAKDGFINKSFRSPWDFYNPRSLRDAFKLKTFNNAYDSVSRFISNEKLQKALAFQTLYIGISPYNGPSIYTIIPMIELLYGVWFIQGGMYTMVTAMAEVFAGLGGKLHLNQPVQEILFSGKQAVGLGVAGEKIPADHVVCNADFPYAVTGLIKDNWARGKYSDSYIEKMEYSCSCFLLYLGLKRQYPEQRIHNIWFAQDFDTNLEDIFSRRVAPQDPSFYMYFSSHGDASTAPEGGDALYVLVPVPDLGNGDQWGGEQVSSYREQILSRLARIQGMEDIREQIAFEEIITPRDFQERFNAYRGATFGLRPTLRQSNYFRPQNRYPYAQNLYFAGSSVHPGAGVPIVLTSAKLAAQEILRDDGKL